MHIKSCDYVAAEGKNCGCASYIPQNRPRRTRTCCRIFVFSPDWAFLCWPGIRRQHGPRSLGKHWL